MEWNKSGPTLAMANCRAWGIRGVADRPDVSLQETRFLKLRATLTDFGGFLATEFNRLPFACRP